MDIIKKKLVYGQEVDEFKLKEELGDLFHYMTQLMNVYGFTLDDIMKCNMTKLRKRYPNGYNNHDAIHNR